MAQKVMQKEAVQTSVPNQQPSKQSVKKPTEKKKSKWWLWLIIALIVIGGGLALYFLVF
jgi:serine/threonine-protein kinase